MKDTEGAPGLRAFGALNKGKNAAMHCWLLVLIFMQIVLSLSVHAQPPAEGSAPPPAAATPAPAAPSMQPTAPAEPAAPVQTPAQGPIDPAAAPAVAPGSEVAPRSEDIPVVPATQPSSVEGVTEPAAAVTGEPAPAPAAAVEPPAAALDPASAEASIVEPEEDGTIEVTVVGTRIAKTAGSAHVLKPQQLERFEYDDPHAALLQVPGVYVRQEDGVGLRPNISLRGVNSDRSKKVTLMEDGILFAPAPYSAPAAYYFPILTRMSNVRVIKGPSSVAYGPQTVGGAIDMVTRAIPSRPAGYLDLGFGQFGYGKAHGYAGASDAQTGFLIEGVHLQSTGFKQLGDDLDTGFNRNEWMVKASHILDPTADVTHEFRIKLGYSDEVSNETYLGLSDADFADNPDLRYPASALDQMSYHRTALLASHVLQVGNDFSLTTTAYRQDFDRTWTKLNGLRGASVAAVLSDPLTADNAGFYAVLRGAADSEGGADTLLIGPNRRTYVSQGVQTLLESAFHTGPLGHRFEAGLRLHYDSIERRHSQSGYLMSDGGLLPEETPTEVTVTNEGSALALSAHVLDAITWGDLTLTPGLRMELIRSQVRDHRTQAEASDTQVVPLPGVGAFYNLTADFGVLAGVYRGFSPAVVDDEQGGSAEPEFSVNYEAGARYATRRSRAEVIAFLNDYSNLTNICTFSSGCTLDDLDQQFDGNAVNIYGVELYGEHTFRLGRFSLPLTAAYTYTRSRFLSSFESSDPTFGTVEEGDELPYVPRHQFNTTAALQHRSGGIVVGLTYTSVAREQAGGGSLASVQTTDSLLWLDVGASLKVLDEVELYANVRNLFDRRAIVSRRPFGARPNAPRTVQVGIKGRI